MILECDCTRANASAIAEIDVFGGRDLAHIHVRVSSAADRAMVAAAVAPGRCHILIKDLEEVVRASEQDLAESRRASAKVTGRGRRQAARWHDTYHTYDETKEWYTSVADDFPLITKLVPSIGLSGEG